VDVTFHVHESETTMSTPHPTTDATNTEAPRDLRQPQDPQPTDRPDVAAQHNAPTEPITQAGAVPPNGPYPPYAGPPPMYPNQPNSPNQANGVSDKVRNAVIAGGIGVAVVFGLIGFGAGYVVGDSSSSNQGPGMNMQRGGGFGGPGGFNQMPDGQGGMGQMPGQQGQMPGQQGQLPGQQGQLPGQEGQTMTPSTESGTGA
jgi:hypothetical protein